MYWNFLGQAFLLANGGLSQGFIVNDRIVNTGLFLSLEGFAYNVSLDSQGAFGGGTAWETITIYPDLSSAPSPFLLGGSGSSSTPGKTPTQKSKSCVSGANASGQIQGHTVTQTVTGCVGGCVSANGETTVGTPSFGVTIDTSIDAPEQLGIGNLPPMQVGIGLGKFASIGTYFVLGDPAPHGFFYSAGPALGLPISVTMTLHKGQGCGGSGQKLE
jgi:hypothetical protein